jgi:hypothetical protein
LEHDVDVTILAADANTEPSWAKVIALLVAVGIFWIFTQVHKRRRAVKEGTEINPFSSEAPEGTENDETQVSAPADTPEEAPQKGRRKWFGKG